MCFLSDICRYMAFELNEKVLIKVRTKQFSLYGKHDVTKLQHLLNEFIRKFVVCGWCNMMKTMLVSS